jgi:hypothetical protein
VLGFDRKVRLGDVMNRLWWRLTSGEVSARVSSSVQFRVEL